MSRIENVRVAGFFALPPEVGELIKTYFTAPHGGRMLDPCVGEGDALIQIAQAHNLIPFGVELNGDRAKTAHARIRQMLGDQARLRHVVADDYRNLRTSQNAYNLLYENPPYMFTDDKLDGRAEYQWLRDTREYLQPGGLLVWVVPRHMLRHNLTVRYLATWFDDMQIYRFPDDSYERFQQIVLFGLRKTKSANPDPAQIARLKAASEEGALLPLEPAQEPFYTLPTPIVPDERFYFRGLFISAQEAVDETITYGIQNSSEFQDHFSYNVKRQHLNPLTPMKIGHLTGVIAAGHINNQVLEDGPTRLLIKGHSHKMKTLTRSREDRESGHVEKTFYTDSVVTNITTVSKDGAFEEHGGPNLAAFLAQWIGPLTKVITQSYPPRYTFNLNGYGEILGKMNMGRKIPILNRPGLLPAQKHAAAAAATRLETHDDAIIVGEMGTGKTLMATATIAALGKKTRMKHAIVLCPPHLVKKWEREIKIVWPKANTIILEERSDVDRFFAAEGPIIGVMKETTARAASGWHHSFHLSGPASTTRRHPRNPVEFITTPLLLHTHTDLQEKGIQANESALLKLRNRRRLRCPTCGEKVFEKDTPAMPLDFKSNKRFCDKCNNALHQDARRPAGPDGFARYPLATYIKKHYKKKLDLLIADEAHEYKGGDSDRGYAFHRMATAARKTLALTGTIYGGKASTLFFLLYRMSPDVRRAYTDPNKKGLSRLMVTKWVSEYGILQEIETDSYDEHGKQTGNSKSRKQIKELPGASPSMLPWLLNNAIFVSLKDMGFALPEYEEIPIAVEMTGEMKTTYRRINDILSEELRKRLLVDDKSLLGAYLQTLLTWPDSPWRTKGVTTPKGQPILRQPPLSDPPGSYPKEVAILNLIEQEKAAGRRCVLMCQQTNLLDITPHWMMMLEERGIKGVVLNVEPTRREAWIRDQVEKHDVDVIITHPRKVQTGLDLLDFPTIIWMGTEYSIYTVLQASRRAWRIGQAHKCKVYFFVYEDTLQERALHLIASKIAAAVRVNGDTVESDSLADMDEYASADIVTALSKMLIEEIDFNEEMKEVNEAYQQAMKGNLTYSPKYSFDGCNNIQDIKKLYRTLAYKFHPDTAEKPERKVESLNDVFAKANAEFQADREFIGDFEMEDDYVPEPEPEPVKQQPAKEKLNIDDVPRPVLKRMRIGPITFGEAADMYEGKRRKAKPVSELQMSLFG